MTVLAALVLVLSALMVSCAVLAVIVTIRMWR